MFPFWIQSSPDLRRVYNFWGMLLLCWSSLVLILENAPSVSSGPFHLWMRIYVACKHQHGGHENCTNAWYSNTAESTECLRHLTITFLYAPNIAHASKNEHVAPCSLRMRCGSRIHQELKGLLNYLLFCFYIKRSFWCSWEKQDVGHFFRETNSPLCVELLFL